jgi:hypothetical protein
VREIKDATQKTPDDCDAIKDLKDAVRSRVEYRIKISDAVRIATLLDPSLKHVILASPELTFDEAKGLLCSSARKAVEIKRFAESQNAESSASLRDSNPSSSATLQTLNQLCLLHLSVKKNRKLLINLEMQIILVHKT